MIIHGQYFDGYTPVGVPAKMNFDGREAELTTYLFTERFLVHHLKVSPRQGMADRFITLPKAGQFVCAGNDFLDSLPQDSPSEGPVAWLEERWLIALACIAIVFCTLLAGYYLGLPAIAERVVARTPIETEQYLGKQAFALLDKEGWLKPTKIGSDTQKSITAGFDRLCRNLPFGKYYRLHFRSSKVFGANAMALPGGIVVVTDDMVEASKTTEEVVAVLAHEIGHVELRHTMKSVLQNSIIGLAAATVTSDAASLSVAVAGLPMAAAQTKYSRKFETEADDYAFKLLKRNGYSPTAFATIMERLTKKYEQDTGVFAYLSSHPITAQRVQRARDAAK